MCIGVPGVAPVSVMTGKGAEYRTQAGRAALVIGGAGPRAADEVFDVSFLLRDGASPLDWVALLLLFKSLRSCVLSRVLRRLTDPRMDPLMRTNMA